VAFERFGDLLVRALGACEASLAMLAVGVRRFETLAQVLAFTPRRAG
jgi:hypothetical protein